MLEIRTARSGKTTARIGGLFINSAYNPELEARRFLKESLKEECPSLVLFLGAEIGYGIRAIRSRFPRIRLLAVFYDQELYGRCLARELLDAAWHPGSDQPLIGFLRHQVHELECEGLAILEWPASARIFPRFSMDVRRQLAQLLRELRGSLATTAAAGRRWLRNSLLNFLGIDRVLSPQALGQNRPVLIAASGPSLERAVTLIARHRERLSLWALPSAVCCLLAGGLVPDLVILTDSSYYAMSHLHPLAQAPAPVAMPLSAAAGTWRIPAGVIYLCQDAFYERSLLQAAGYPAVPALPQGTVAATAIGLAKRFSQGGVIFAGLDLCYKDIHGHARPNVFELFLASGEDRLRPFHQRLFARAAELAPRRANQKGAFRSSIPLETYAGWFASLESGEGGGLFRLFPSAVSIPGMPGMSADDFARYLDQAAAHGATGGQKAFAAFAGYPGYAERSRIALAQLEAWLSRLEELKNEVARQGSLDPLFAGHRQLTLAYHLDAAGLAQIKRLARLKGEVQALRKAGEFLERQCLFLTQLAGRMGRQA